MAFPAVYSTRFIGATVSDRVDYLVPPNMRAVVRDITIVTYASSATDCRVLVAGLFTIFRESTNPLGDVGSLHWVGRQVVNSGETIRVFIQGQPVEAAVCGYLLSAS